ncbi:MAG TPA: helix-turn-helix domain-containing protein [Candidatus Thermoplasmatota archaeon]|jgi:predicted transcriptional regulator|nr:helix-turn-helix domain-containing protein [Candidatus Thermoplasmatota archaeon]
MRALGWIALAALAALLAMLAPPGLAAVAFLADAEPGADVAPAVRDALLALPPEAERALREVARMAPELQAHAQTLVLSGLATLGAGLLGFRFVHRDNVLEHTFRHEMVALVRADPGLHLREIARRLDTTTSNAAYHLRVLQKHGLVRGEHVNGKLVFVPAAGREEQRRHVAGALLHARTRASIVAELSARPGASQSALATLTHQRQSAVAWHLRQLVAAGLVEEHRGARAFAYRLTPLGQELTRAGASVPVAARL